MVILYCLSLVSQLGIGIRYAIFLKDRGTSQEFKLDIDQLSQEYFKMCSQKLTRKFSFMFTLLQQLGSQGWRIFIFLLRQALEKLQASVENEQGTGYKSNPVVTPGQAS